MAKETNADACQIVVDYIIGRIERRELNIGDRIEPERTLSANLNVSRSTVREAIRVLNFMGYLDSTQGSGNYISGKYSRTVASIMRVMYLREEIGPETFTEFRQMLELAAFDAALVNASDKQKGEMKQIVELLDVTQDDKLIFVLDNRFHHLLVEASGNPLLRLNFVSLNSVTEQYMSDTFYGKVSKQDQGFKTLQKYHHAMIDALISGDAKKGHEAIRAHFKWAMQKK